MAERSFLDKVLAETHRRVAEARAHVPEAELQRRLVDAAPVRPLQDALRGGFGLIAEYKRRTPSSGTFNPRYVHASLSVYAETKAIRAVSVLTEPNHFGGRLRDLTVARVATEKPVLAKDFIVDPYQILEARAFGADAVLLLAVVHGRSDTLARLVDTARGLGMAALVELGPGPIALDLQARSVPPAPDVLWGVNGRDLGTLETDPAAHARYRSLIPSGALAVAESGIRNAGTLAQARAAGYHAALVGAAFLTSPPADVAKDFQWICSP